MGDYSQRIISNKASPGGPFVFVAGVLVLDFVNTEVIMRRRRRDLLNTPSALLDWYAKARQYYPELTHEPFDAEGTLPLALQLRAALRSALELLVGDQPLTIRNVELVNQLLRHGHYQLEVADDGRIISRYIALNPSPEQVLLPIANSAQWLFTTTEFGRLHQCRNPDCILFFYDSTRSATRSWCSQGCMNRARSHDLYHMRNQATG